MSGVDDDESIIVALDVKGGAAIATEGATDANQLLFFSMASGSSSTVAGRQIVIEVQMKDINRYADGDQDLDGLRSRARVTSYVTPSKSTGFSRSR